MDTSPLTLSLLRLTPHTLFPPTSNTPSPSHSPVPLDDASTPHPPLPPPQTLSPTHNYPSPFGLITLGSSLSILLNLSNTSPLKDGISGIRMMCEIQTPTTRYRLGEAIHGQSVPEGEPQAEEEEAASSILPYGESIQLDVESEMKELGSCIIICSVAWETDQGRRTFQRFLKYNVIPPLSIKTRIQTSPHSNILLNPSIRQDTNLEILIQNSSPEPLLFDTVQLEPVHNLLSSPVPLPQGLKEESLLPGDTRQYLFTLSPASHECEGKSFSVFPPIYPGGSILPLGRLDVSWFAGQYRHPGRLQTSTLNRRIPVVPLSPPRRDDEDEYGEWEFDLCLLELKRSGVEVEKEFEAVLRVGVRSRHAVSKGKRTDPLESPPPPLRIGVQYLTRSTPSAQIIKHPSTPIPPPRPLSAASTESRTMSPVPPQTRQATSHHLNTPGPSTRHNLQATLLAADFPPPPAFSGALTTLNTPLSPLTSGEVAHLGCSLAILDAVEFELVEENVGTTYNVNDETPKRWEAVYEHALRFMALDEGLAELGGLRVLCIDEIENGTVRGSVGKEWDSLGDVWVEG